MIINYKKHQFNCIEESREVKNLKLKMCVIKIAMKKLPRE